MHLFDGDALHDFLNRLREADDAVVCVRFREGDADPAESGFPIKTVEAQAGFPEGIGGELSDPRAASCHVADKRGFIDEAAEKFRRTGPVELHVFPSASFHFSGNPQNPKIVVHDNDRQAEKVRDNVCDSLKGAVRTRRFFQTVFSFSHERHVIHAEI